MDECAVPLVKAVRCIRLPGGRLTDRYEVGIGRSGVYLQAIAKLHTESVPD